MKRKEQKTQRGITLIALVITIIVLLILAGVAINMAINSDGLFGKANEATQRWNEAVKKDEEAITNLTESWEQDKTTIKKGSTTLKVGDIVNYDETKKGTITGIKDVTWKVLGAENGNILLMSTTDVGTLTLNGKEGYTNGLQQLKDMCTPYGQGEKANGARNITIEDINRVTGYDVNKGFYDTSSETYKVYGYGTAYEYLKVNNYADRVLVGHYKGNDWKTGAAEIESNYYHIIQLH